MAMIHPAEILRRPPRECLVLDATGRQLANVFTCNPETGEVICYDMPWITRAWIRLLWTRVDRRHPLRPLIQPGWTCLLTRHGFWPAPLQLVVQIGSVPAVRARLVDAQGRPDRRLTLTRLNELIDAVEVVGGDEEVST